VILFANVNGIAVYDDENEKHRPETGCQETAAAVQ
jgi:hypothetical protein